MSAATMQSHCALCGGSEQRMRFRDGPFNVVACCSCELTYVTPRLVDEQLIERVYDELYWSSPIASERGYTDYAGDAELYLRTFERRVTGLEQHLMPRHMGPGRVLDIGCAAGYFLQVMQRRGWDVHGVEPSRSIAKLAERDLGPGRVHPDLQGDTGFEPKSFDLVTLWDVLEHLPEPVDTLRAAAELLRPGGRLLVETQNVGSLFAHLLGRRWQHYKHAEHLWHFDRRTLDDALSRAGLRTLKMTSRHAGKFVSAAFVHERISRFGHLASSLAAPLGWLGQRSCYINPFDELIVVATAD